MTPTVAHSGSLWLSLANSGSRSLAFTLPILRTHRQILKWRNLPTLREILDTRHRCTAGRQQRASACPTFPSRQPAYQQVRQPDTATTSDNRKRPRVETVDPRFSRASTTPRPAFHSAAGTTHRPLSHGLPPPLPATIAPCWTSNA